MQWHNDHFYVLGFSEPCPGGFVLFRDTCYSLGASGPLSWQESQADCQVYPRGHLASIHETEEIDFIASNILGWNL